jgi:broad specificity phosphatase PhoE
MRELILVRHGQSRYNMQLTDHLDSELTEEGHRQVHLTGRFLRQHLGHLHEFVGRCSPYLRCLQTARILREETGIDFWVDDGPREIMVRHEKAHVLCRHREFPEFAWDRFLGDCSYHQEDVETFNSRMKKYVECLTENPFKALVVTHGTPATVISQMIQGIYDGIPGVHTGQYVDNSSISYFRHGEQVWFNKVVYGFQDPQVAGPGDNDVAV